MICFTDQWASSNALQLASSNGVDGLHY